MRIISIISLAWILNVVLSSCLISNNKKKEIMGDSNITNDVLIGPQNPKPILTFQDLKEILFHHDSDFSSILLDKDDLGKLTDTLVFERFDKIYGGWMITIQDSLVLTQFSCVKGKYSYELYVLFDTVGKVKDHLSLKMSCYSCERWGLFQSSTSIGTGSPIDQYTLYVKRYDTLLDQFKYKNIHPRFIPSIDSVFYWIEEDSKFNSGKQAPDTLRFQKPRE